MVAPRLLPLLCALLLPGPVLAAGEPVKAALFPVELLEPGVVVARPLRPDETRRLGLATEELRRQIDANGALAPVDLAPQAAQIRKDAPLYKCEGCAERIAREAGAAVAVYGYVQRNTNQVLNVTITITDTASGKVLRGGQAVISGDTDETWRHGVRWVVKNRLLAEPLPDRS
ncbi:DUF3280 domain-containing protein [Methylobacterium oryzihabitans]|uniref:DUF2380 domain-containing protein n=1 Tax=Methylobacterium oryzihabitans TaxID=2499852 RepID=A0A437PHA1_9HYPH|nr:DUF3280 domain-containing protein [Methylobacterium oryzihabitans]RVU21607.1 DUF2380 domain-containing protein [Methylobacterium oryzihabitans]